MLENYTVVVELVDETKQWNAPVTLPKMELTPRACLSV